MNTERQKQLAPQLSPALTKEQRLAQRLRENLHRRKSQAREIEGGQTGLPSQQESR